MWQPFVVIVSDLCGFTINLNKGVTIYRSVSLGWISRPAKIQVSFVHSLCSNLLNSRLVCQHDSSHRSFSCGTHYWFVSLHLFSM